MKLYILKRNWTLCVVEGPNNAMQFNRCVLVVPFRASSFLCGKARVKSSVRAKKKRRFLYSSPLCLVDDTEQEDVMAIRIKEYDR